MADKQQPPDPSFNPYNPFSSYVNVLTSGVAQNVDKALAPLDKNKPQTANPPANRPPGYAKGVSKVETKKAPSGSTRMGMLKGFVNR
jgi:hypothetical protein